MRPISPSDTRADGNSFTFVRLVLATTVIFSHGFALTGHAADDPSLKILPYPISAIAVLLFFSLSGFLVTGGLMRNGVRAFVIARALRLTPGLAVMLAVTALGGAAFAGLPLRTYLADPSVRTYVGRNLFFIGHAYSIAGVFADNPVRTVVNGSLWTIPNEVRCYLALAVAGTVGALRSRVAVLALFLLLLIAHIAVPMTFHPVYAVERRLALSFLSGVTLYLWRDRVMLSGPLAVALPALAIILPMGEMRATAIFLAASYAMLVVAFRSPASIKRSSSQVPDYSYGIYIYAFPVQQALVALGIGTSPVINVVTTLPLILIFAAASWHMVEAPALRLKPQGVRVRGLPHGSGA